MDASLTGYFGGMHATRHSGEGLAKEQFQLRHIIDKFFDTIDGYAYHEKEFPRTPEEIARNVPPTFYKEPIRTGPNVFNELKRLKLMICGGTINSIFSGMTVNDLDFYMKDAAMAADAKNFFHFWFPHAYMESINACTFKRKSKYSRKHYCAQLITRFVGTAQDIFNWFDFTITHGAFDFETDEFVFGPRFFPDLAKKRLVYSGSSKYPICAMYRTNKYTKRGYELPGATVMHIALSIVQLKITNYGELKQQLMGVDTIFLQKLLEAKAPDAPVDYGEFIYEAFQTIDRITGDTLAEAEEGEE